MTSRNYCFTCFKEELVEDAFEGWPQFYELEFKNCKDLRYISCQRERCPVTGRLHIQGYVEFNAPVRRTVFQKFLNDKCHMDKRAGTQEQADAYTKKEESRECVGWFEWGEKGKPSGGCRSDGMIKWLQENPTVTFKEFVTEWETEFIRYGKQLQTIYEMFKPKQKMFEYDSLLPLQQEMLEALETQNNRQITWIYDKKGGCGKSELANYLTDRGDTFWCSSAKTTDIIHAFSKEEQPFVVIDLMKSVEHIPYQLMEAFKNGRAFTAKYDSKPLTFKKCKVLVLSNQLPDKDMLSEDRWDIRTVTGQKDCRHLSRGGGNTSPTPKPDSVTKKFCMIELDEK